MHYCSRYIYGVENTGGLHSYRYDEPTDLAVPRINEYLIKYNECDMIHKNIMFCK